MDVGLTTGKIIDYLKLSVGLSLVSFPVELALFGLFYDQ
jgi:hypothetical protein